MWKPTYLAVVAEYEEAATVARNVVVLEPIGTSVKIALVAL